MKRKAAERWTGMRFVIRRPSQPGAGERVVAVCAASPEAARWGLGLCRDEVATLQAAPFFASWVPPRGPRPQEMADFFQCFGTSLRGGLSLSASLAAAARQASSATMRGVVGALALGISKGRELHELMDGLQPFFKADQVALARAASKSGMQDAGRLFSSLAEALQKDARVGRKLLGALGYPLMLLVMALGAAVVLELKALPPMVELFRTMGARLPWVTELFYSLSTLLGAWLFLWLPSLVVAGILMPVGFRRFLACVSVQRRLPRLWCVGPVVLARALCRALGVFVLLRQGGASNRDVFQLAAQASGNALVSDFFLRTHRRVAMGEGIEQAFLAERHLLGEEGVRLAGRMEAGVTGGELPQLIHSMIGELEERVELRLALLPRMLEFPLLGLCGLVIGSIILAMFLPYPSLLGDVARQMRG